ncbi:hypothetical protein [Nonomuraea helvata]|uniref:Uncharacterized protein n=1 Tax=Nonomuraea helvata TaxID=37484 RepID=A0ABV5SI23_9ACTN
MLGDRIKLYWDLHTHAWSIVALRGDRKGRVVGKADNVTLAGVTFRVSAPGRADSHRRGHRTVHAWVLGTVVSIDRKIDVSGMIKITYNWAADRASTFETPDGTPMFWAPLVLIARDPRKKEHGYGWVASGNGGPEAARS